jgi:TRAP-type mannitol/chloroaromatic compound transport system permease small subunit
MGRGTLLEETMRALASIVRVISRLNGIIGAILSFLSLAIVLVCFCVVLLRYGFRTGSVPLQDLYVWLNGVMFMGIAGYALLKDGHVRVDIFYREASKRRRAQIDIAGSLLFIAPFLVLLTLYAWPYVSRSWAMAESSPNFGGLPGLFLLKSFLLVFVGVVGLQAVALSGRGILVLAGREDLLPPDLRYASVETEADPEPGV